MNMLTEGHEYSPGNNGKNIPLPPFSQMSGGSSSSLEASTKEINSKRLQTATNACMSEVGPK
jgi:hypothetical protein